MHADAQKTIRLPVPERRTEPENWFCLSP